MVDAQDVTSPGVDPLTASEVAGQTSPAVDLPTFATDEAGGDGNRPVAEAGPAVPADELLAQAERWGLVGDDGVVRVREGMFAGRAVGRVQWYDRGEALTRLALAFRELDEQYQALDREVRAAATKAAFLGRVRRLLDRAGTVKALGDFDRLVMGLRALEREILDQIEERTRRKEELAARAEALSGSTEWKATGEPSRRC